MRGRCWQLNMKQLKYVLVLANAGTFSKAADLLSISQPSLSQYVKNIEKELGIVLFDRTGGKLKLTDAGHVYIEAGRKILDLEKQMQDQFADLASHKIGRITVGTTPFRSVGMMPLIAAEFKKQYPGVCIVVDERGAYELLEALEQAEIDMCVCPLPEDTTLFDSEIIMEEELVLAVPAALADRFHAEQTEDRKYPVIDVFELEGKPFVMVTENQIMQKTLNRLCQEYDLHLTQSVVVKSLEAQIAMVQKGLGCALIPTGIEKISEGSKGILCFSLKQMLPRRKIAVLYRKDKYLSQAMRELIAVMQKIDW